MDESVVGEAVDESVVGEVVDESVVGEAVDGSVDNGIEVEPVIVSKAHNIQKWF